MAVFLVIFTGTVRRWRNANGVPVRLAMCQTDPATGHCISAAGPTVTVDMPAGTTRTLAVFVVALGPIPFDPADSRICVFFRGSDQIVRGVTSVAIRTR